LITSTDDPAPSLYPRYRASPLLRAGPPAHPATGAGPRLTGRNPRPVVSWRAFSRSVRERQIRLTSPPCRTPPGQSAGTRQALPEMRNITPVLMPSVFVTTRLQRFACARLPDPHLTSHWMPFPRSLTTTVFSQRSTRRFGASPTQSGSEGPIPSSPEQHHLPRIRTYLIGLLSMFVTHGSAKSR
jgi:hypothetical protein